MGLIPLLMTHPAAFFALVIPLLYSVIFHELAHGLVALWFGDKTAKDAGRLSLNPMVHLSPMGIAMLFFVGFGWAKPVPVDYSRLGRSRLGSISVAFAGCMTNIAIATLAILLLRLKIMEMHPTAASFLSILAKINITLGAFNLIPIPPLDGSKVVMGFLSEQARAHFSRIEPYGFFIIILLLLSGLLYPVIGFMERLIYGFLSFVLKIT